MKTTPMIPTRFTADELDVLECVAKDSGWPWALRHADLCLAQARAIGDLPQREGETFPPGFTCGTRSGWKGGHQ